MVDDLLYSSNPRQTNLFALKYRLDIQGLRALAILAVLVFHLNPAWLPGGFTGVDVFFVISGYLITAILFKGTEQNQPLLRFYSRRISRLFPAYFVMLVLCCITSYCYLFPLQSVDFAQSLFSAALYVSNVYFAASINYLSVDTHLLPLLHTWSLSAEAQCYLIYPIVVYVIVKQNLIRPFGLFCGLFVLMFVLNLALTAYNPDIAFFSPSVRFYQFLGGAVIFYIPTRWQASKDLSKTCFISGLAMIGLGFFAINRFVEYPGLLSFVPTLGTMLLLFSANRSGLHLARLLTNKPMVFLGAISYSLYLWHWPVIVFYKIAVSPVFNPSDYLIVVTISLILASVSWYLLETQLRKSMQHSNAKIIITGSVVATLTLIGLGSVFQLSQGLPSRYSAEQLYFAQTDFSQNSLPKRTTDSCMVFKNWIESFNEEHCIVLEEHTTNILLLGDSHAEHFRRTLEDSSDDIRVSVATISACRPTLPGSGRKSCVQMMEKVYSQTITQYDFDMVIVAGRWSLETIEKMPAAIKRLKQYVNRVVVVGPIITYSQALPTLLARYGSNLENAKFPSRLRNFDSTQIIDQRFKTIARENGVEYISLLDMICPDEQCQLLTESGQPLQWDYGHLTYAGASELIKKMALN